MHPLSRIQLRHRPSRVYAARICVLPLIKPPREYHRLAVLMIDLDWSQIQHPTAPHFGTRRRLDDHGSLLQPLMMLVHERPLPHFRPDHCLVDAADPPVPVDS